MTGFAIVKPEKSFHGNEHQGFVRPIFTINQDGTFEAVDPSDFPNNGSIMVISGYEQLPISANTLLKIEYSDANNFIEDNPTQSKYVTRGYTAERLSNSAICTVIDSTTPTYDNRSIISNIEPTTWLFIRSKENNRTILTGPFTSQTTEHEGIDGNFNLELSPVDTVIPGFKPQSHTAIRIEEELLPKDSILKIGEEYYFTDVRCLSALDYKIVDFCTDEQLLKWGEELLKSQKTIKKISKERMTEMRTAIGQLKKINTPFLEGRKNRLVEVLGDLDEWKGLSSSMLKDYINTSSGKKDLQSYIELNKASYLDELVKKEADKQREDIERQIEIESRRLSQKKSELDEIEEKISSARDQESERIAKDLDTELKEKKHQIDLLNQELENKTLNISRISSLEKLDESKAKIEVEIELLHRQRDNSRDTLKDLKNQLQKETTTYAADLLKLRTELEVLSGETSKNNYENYLTSGTPLLINKSQTETAQRDEIIQYVLEKMNTTGGRDFTESATVNILTTLMQNFITTIAGLPGTGKTSTSNLISKAVSINDLCLQIQVERAWTSPKDLIGYYNPLNSRFQRSSSGLYGLIKAMYETPDLDSLSVALLDEANLSPMEHYWSIFMGMCDSDDNRQLVTGDPDHDLLIPESFRFLATVNYDQTTEHLSPRFLDRSPVIELGSDVQIDLLDDTNSIIKSDDDGYISYTDLYNLFGRAEDASFSNDEKRSFKGILDSLTSNETINSTPVSISPRKILAIKNYCHRTRDILQLDYPTKSLDIAIVQNILPLIEGHGPNYLKRLEQTLTLLPPSGFPASRKRLERIVENGSSNYESFSFFSS